MERRFENRVSINQHRLGAQNSCDVPGSDNVFKFVSPELNPVTQTELSALTTNPLLLNEAYQLEEE
jgi:hypothetical protein